MQPLLQQLRKGSKLSMLRNATWTLSNFCRGKPQPEFGTVRPALPTLAQVINSPDEEVLADAQAGGVRFPRVDGVDRHAVAATRRPRRCWALSYLSDGPNEKIQAVIEAGVCRKLVELLMHPSPSVQTPALRTVGNIVTGNETQTQTVIDAGAVPNLLELFSHSKKGIQKEACWAISNITAGNKDQIQSTIDANVIPPLVKLLKSAEFDVKKEATWAIANATSGGTPRQIEFLVSQDCIPPLCELLSAADEKLVTTALEALGNILQVGSADAGDLSANKMAILIVKSEGPTRIRQVGSARAKAMLESYFQDWESWDLSPVSVSPDDFDGAA